MELETEVHYYTSGNSCISKPKICGSFSVNRERDTLSREYVPDCSQLKFLHRGIATTGIQYDLNYKAETTIGVTPGNDVRFLCHFLKDNKIPIDIFDPSDIYLNDAPFVTYGAPLRVIASLPYKEVDTIFISVSLFKGVIYLLDWHTPDPGPTEKSKKALVWGQKFKQHLLADYCDSKPDIESPLIEGEKFQLVHGAKLGKHRLLYATPVDAVMCEESDEISKGKKTIEMLNDLKFVQLRTNRHLNGQWATNIFMRERSLEFWLLSYLTGVDTILCGHRDEDGVVNDLKFYTTTEFCTKYRDLWQPNVTMNFCNAFMSFVKMCLWEELLKRHGESLENIRDVPKIDLLFVKKPNDNVRLCSDVEHASIIPDWFGELFTKE